MHADLLDPQYDGKCSSDASELEDVQPQQDECPCCGSNLEIGDIKPLATTDTAEE